MRVNFLNFSLNSGLGHGLRYCYHPGYQLGLSPQHPFPMSKYPLLMELLLTEGVLHPGDLMVPEPLERWILEQVHTPEYLDKLESSQLSLAEQRLLGFPWSESLWLRSRLAAGGTLLAARTALKLGLAANLAGGTHHAFADHGEGFCVLNDVAIAITQLRAEGLIDRAAIIDLDVHQGNGTAAIFEGVGQVLSFSMHGEQNYPARKMRSCLDIALPSGVGDAAYLDSLHGHLPAVLESQPEIVFYLAGVDVAAGDRYGKLKLTEQGISSRDRAVIEAVRARGIPLVIVLAGGYAESRVRTAQLHAHVFREAVNYQRQQY